eukprot:scaffold72719_cov18-Tisochrysis_lutea.AAC.1
MAYGLTSGYPGGVTEPVWRKRKEGAIRHEMGEFQPILSCHIYPGGCVVWCNRNHCKINGALGGLAGLGVKGKEALISVVGSVPGQTFGKRDREFLDLAGPWPDTGQAKANSGAYKFWWLAIQ